MSTELPLTPSNSFNLAAFCEDAREFASLCALKARKKQEFGRRDWPVVERLLGHFEVTCTLDGEDRRYPALEVEDPLGLAGQLAGQGLALRLAMRRNDDAS